MAQDKEKIKELTRKIKDLETVLSSRGQQLQDYQDIERIADGNNLFLFCLTFQKRLRVSMQFMLRR